MGEKDVFKTFFGHGRCSTHDQITTVKQCLKDVGPNLRKVFFMCFTSRRLRLKRRLNMVCTRTANRMCLSEFTKCDHRAISQTRVSWCLSPVQIPAKNYAKNDGHGLLFFCWSCHALPNHAASSRVNVALHTVVLHSMKMALKQKRSVNFTSDERMALIELIDGHKTVIEDKKSYAYANKRHGMMLQLKLRHYSLNGRLLQLRN